MQRRFSNLLYKRCKINRTIVFVVQIPHKLVLTTMWLKLPTG
jgi:hypothetical protein